MKTAIVSLLALCLWSMPLVAQGQGENGSPLDEKPAESREPVVIPQYQRGTAGSEIVIRPAEDVVFYEYRVNGQVREIKVVPEIGPAYYLVPAEGGGWIREDETSLLIPSWVIFRW